MSHAAHIAALPQGARAALLERSDRAGLAHLAGHLGLIALTSLYIGFRLPLWELLLLPQGILLCFLFTLAHECTHKTPFATPWLNELLGHVIALPLLLPFTWFRYFHLAHHRHTNDPARDPELAGGGRPRTRGAYLRHLSGWPYWSGNARVLWQNAFGEITAPYLPRRQHPALRREARLLLALYGLIALSLFVSPLALWLWLVPVLLGQPVLRLYLLAEHGHCPPVADMFANSRTTFTTRLVRFLAWNMPYHAEHHAMPNVPFHALPALHRLVAPHLRSTTRGYGRFTARYIRGLE